MEEVDVITKVEELRAAGLWTANRLERLEDPPQDKTYWDYLMMGMLNRGKIMRQEVQWKKMMARKIAFAIVQTHPYLPDLDAWRRDRARKRDQRLEKIGKRICASIAKKVREFWKEADQVAKHRAQEKLEAEKHKALNAHMTFLVGEANKLSSMVQEGMAQNNGSKTPSVASNEEDDSDFRGTDSESDDEATIAQEEAAMKQHERVAVEEEVSALNKEADQEMDDLLASLPPEYLASMGIELPLKSAPASDLPADSEGKKEAIKVKGKRRGAKGDKVPTNNAKDNEENVNTERSTPEKPHDEHSGSRKKSDEKPSSIVESEGNGQGMLSNVDYAKLNSKDEIVRQKELDSIAEAAMKLRPKGNTLQTTQVKTAVPFLIKGTLREYQMVGLDWLVTLYENNVNGILADEMGLGKTIQTIALLAHLACVHRIWGPHLIIVPNSVILNWEMEFKKWCPAFKILTYYGSQKERAEKRRGWTKPNTFHVCIASYNTVTTDIRSFKRKEWQYMILDEAHNIKNFKSQRWQALLNVRSHSRLLLTGTPLQNSLMELWSLMHFLMPEIFSSHDDFKQWFSNPLTGMVEGSIMYSSHLMGQLHKVLRPFVLRRLKRDVEKELPEKTEHVLKVPLSKRQRYLYDDFMSRRSTRENLKSGNMLSVLNIVMQLRKCCNHPDLFEPRDVVSPMYVEKIRYVPPGLIVDLNEKEFGRDLPVFFDLRKRFTGVSTPTAVDRPPPVSEIVYAKLRPPVVPGFCLRRPTAMSSVGRERVQEFRYEGIPVSKQACVDGERLVHYAGRAMSQSRARVRQVGQAPLVSEIVESTSAGRPTVVLDSRSQRPTAKSSVDREKIPKLASESPAVPVRASVGGERLVQDADRLMPQKGSARVGPIAPKLASGGSPAPVQANDGGEQLAQDAERLMPQEGGARVGPIAPKLASAGSPAPVQANDGGEQLAQDAERLMPQEGGARVGPIDPKLASESPAVPVRASVGGERLAQDADRLTPQEGCARARQFVPEHASEGPSGPVRLIPQEGCARTRQFVPKHASERAPVTVRTDVGGERLVQHAGQFMPQEDDARVLQVDRAQIMSEISESTNTGRPPVSPGSHFQRPTAVSSVEREVISKLASGGPPAPVQANDGGEQLAQDANRLIPQEGGARVGPIVPRLASGGPPAPVEANDGGEQLAQDAEQKGGARVGPTAPKLASGRPPAPVQANDGGEQLAQDADRLMPQKGGARVGPIVPKLASGGPPAPVQANDGGEQLAQDADRLMPQEDGARVGPIAPKLTSAGPQVSVQANAAGEQVALDAGRLLAGENDARVRQVVTDDSGSRVLRCESSSAACHRAPLSPQRKRRRLSWEAKMSLITGKRVVKGRFFDLVPANVRERKWEDYLHRIRSILRRFECKQRPIYSTQLISLLDLEGEHSSPQMKIFSDVRDTMNEWVEEVMDRFWMYVNPALTESPSFEPTSLGGRVAVEQVSNTSRELFSMVHPLTHKTLVYSQLQFPERRLIEYDCGKLQALSRLLRALYSQQHRCLIFTQMSKMLNILECFLSHHGYQYFRLDGATGIEQRQAMMERFNVDPKIFCFILSTRSGGVGVNLTGADTVIFYDSDWNPTMDAQAQDRCHRIGQTRNVSIWRLISAHTIEENILRKANQKRRLGEMAIDDAGFTPEFFKQSENIRDLFNGDVEIGDIVVDEAPKSQKDVDKALASLEDEQDVAAAEMVTAEMNAEMNADTAEFDEKTNTDEVEFVQSQNVKNSGVDDDKAAEIRYNETLSKLRPIERYAIKMVEAEYYEPWLEEEAREIEATMDQKRKSLEISKSTAPSDDDADDENDESLSQRSAVSRRQKQRGSRRKSRRQSVADPSSAAASPRSSSQVMCTDSSTPIQQKSAPQTPERPAMQETAAAASTPRREPSPASECRSVADPITAAASPRSSSQVMCTDSSTPIQQKSAPQTPELLAMQETAAAASTPRREPSPASECQSVADPITAAASPRSSSQVMCTDSSTPIRQKSAPQTPERPAVQETAAAASTPRREPSSGEDSDSNSWADWTVSPFESPVKQKQGQGQDETVGDSLSCDKNPMPSQESICAAEETLQKPPTVPEISVQNLAEETEQECGTVQKPLDGKKSPLLSQESTASSEESLKETHTTPESPLQKSAEEVGRQGETLHKSLAGDRSPLPLEEIPGKSAIVKNPEQEPVEETEHQHDITAQKQTSLAGKRKRLQSQGSATPSKRIPKKPAIAPENPEEELAKKKEQQHSLTVPKQKSHAGKRKRLSSQRSATPSKETPKKAPIASENPEEELAEETEQHGGTAQTQKPPACKRKRLPPQESATPSKKTPKKPSAAPENPAEELAEEKEQHGGTAQTQKPLAGKRKRLSSQGSATPSKKTPKKPSATPENPTEEPPLTKVTRRRTSSHHCSVCSPLRVLQSPAGASRPPPSQPAALDVTHAPAQPSPPLLVQPPSVGRAPVPTTHSESTDDNSTSSDDNSTSSDDNSTSSDDNSTSSDDNSTSSDDNSTSSDDNSTSSDDNSTSSDDNSTSSDDNSTSSDDNSTSSDSGSTSSSDEPSTPRILPVRRVTVQPRNGRRSPTTAAPGLGDYERPRLYFRRREPTSP